MVKLQISGSQNTVQVYDIRATLINNIKVQSGQHSFDMKAFFPGIYFFRISNNKNIQSFKVIKE